MREQVVLITNTFVRYIVSHSLKFRYYSSGNLKLSKSQHFRARLLKEILLHPTQQSPHISSKSNFKTDKTLESSRYTDSRSVDNTNDVLIRKASHLKDTSNSSQASTSSISDSQVMKSTPNRNGFFKSLKLIRRIRYQAFRKLRKATMSEDWVMFDKAWKFFEQTNLPIDEVFCTYKIWASVFNTRVNSSKAIEDLSKMKEQDMDSFIIRVNQNLLDSYFELKELHVLTIPSLAKAFGSITSYTATTIKTRQVKLLHSYLQQLDANDALMTSAENLEAIAREKQALTRLPDIPLNILRSRKYQTRRFQRLEPLSSLEKQKTLTESEGVKPLEKDQLATSKDGEPFSTEACHQLSSNIQEKKLEDLASVYLTKQAKQNKRQSLIPIPHSRRTTISRYFQMGITSTDDTR